MEVSTLKDSIDQVLTRLESAGGAEIKGREDKKSLEKLLIKWEQTKAQQKISSAVAEAMSTSAAALTTEIHKSHIPRKTVVGILRRMKTAWFGAHVAEQVSAAPFLGSQIAHELEQARDALADPLEREYFEEAAAAQSRGSNRAFVVMFWNIVMNRLYRLAEAKGLAALAAKINENRRHKGAVNDLADLYELGDKSVIDALRALGWIDKHQHEVLDAERKRRNRCAHVSFTYKPDDATVLYVLRELSDSVIRNL